MQAEPERSYSQQPIRAGFIPLTIAQATFGLLFYLFIFIITGSSLVDDIPGITFLKDIVVTSWLLYLCTGFLGGFFGKSLLKLIPYLKELVRQD